MKKSLAIVLLLLLAGSTQLLLAQNALTFSPAKPQPGQTVKFTYDLTNSPLRNSTDAIEALVLESGERSPSLQGLVTLRQGDKLSGEFSTDKKSSAAILIFKSGERHDNNKGAGYTLLLHDATGKPLPDAKAAQAMLMSASSRIFEVNADTRTMYDLYQESFKLKPGLDQAYATNYLPVMMSIKGDPGKTEAQALLDAIAKNPKSKEEDLLYAARTYERVGAPEKATALRTKIKTTWPKGLGVQQERQKAINSEADLEKRQALIEAYAQDFPPATDKEKEAVSQLWFNLVATAAQSENWAKVDALAPRLSPMHRASVYNNIAWELAEKNKELDRAERYGNEATTIGRNNISNPYQPKQPMQTMNQWAEERQYMFAQNADTYAFVLAQKGNNDAAAKLQREVVEISKGENTEMNERYTQFLEAAHAADLRYQLEGFIMRGQATDKMKQQFARIYQAEEKSEAGTTAYLAQLDQLAAVARRQKLASSMLDMPAPGFSLKNLAGETVSLESQRGKVVVVDFWATWCGPCKASFPGMQKAQEKFKDDSKVSFLFLDTWENAADKQKNANDFITGKGYPFHVLLDDDNKVVSSYGVNGIPTKFVVDGSGKIRFKAVGFNGEDELISELTTMIELAKEQP